MFECGSVYLFALVFSVSVFFYIYVFLFFCIFVCTRLAGGVGLRKQSLSPDEFVCMCICLYLQYMYICVFKCVHMCLFVQLCALDWQQELGLRKQSVSPDG